MSWADTLSHAEVRAFRQAHDYRDPYCRMSENEVVLLINSVLAVHLKQGTKVMMLEAAEALKAYRALTAYAKA